MPDTAPYVPTVEPERFDPRRIGVSVVEYMGAAAAILHQVSPDRENQ